MRSRYTAYARGAVDYLVATHAPPPPREEVAGWAERAQFLSLQILGTRDGQAADQKGEVEFLVRYHEAGADRLHHERSRFGRVNGQWRYLDALPAARPGRNDPCLCGSGKKFKKCCGAAGQRAE